MTRRIALVVSLLGGLGGCGRFELVTARGVDATLGALRSKVDPALPLVELSLYSEDEIDDRTHYASYRYFDGDAVMFQHVSLLRSDDPPATSQAASAWDPKASRPLADIDVSAIDEHVRASIATIPPGFELGAVREYTFTFEDGIQHERWMLTALPVTRSHPNRRGITVTIPYQLLVFDLDEHRQVRAHPEQTRSDTYIGTL